jgi:tagatose 1,6-diphosphate aldolase
MHRPLSQSSVISPRLWLDRCKKILPHHLNRATPFVFYPTGSLQDHELELTAPAAHWADALMASITHPDTIAHAASLSQVSRRQIDDFLSSCPQGRQLSRSSVGGFPCYHFWMLDHSQPQLPIAGAVCLRIGNGLDIERHYGHVGYHVYPPHRGRHFAQRAVRLLLPLARAHGINPVWITCNPENQASRRTCERLGAILTQTVAVPTNHPLAKIGEAEKCCYRLDIPC